MKPPLGVIPFLLAGLVVITAPGCDRTESTRAAKPVAKPPATNPAPATTQAAKVPTFAMTIGGESFDFPLAKLRLTSKDGAVVADLFSDDPKEAIEDKYTGNSFYLVMPLEGDDPRALGQSTWVYKAASGTRAETTTGIFLHGTKYRLQPYEVKIELLPAGPTALVSIRGQFLRFATKQDGLPTTMAVEADLKATVEYK